jgi:hypothetical protein
MNCTLKRQLGWLRYEDELQRAEIAYDTNDVEAYAAVLEEAHKRNWRNYDEG